MSKKKERLSIEHGFTDVKPHIKDTLGADGSLTEGGREWVQS